MKNSITLLLLTFILQLSLIVSAQIGVNSDGSQPDPSAMLDVKSTQSGMLLPRMTNTQMNSIMNPANGLFVYLTDENNFYYYDGTSWKLFSGGTDGDWIVSGNSIYSFSNIGIGLSNPAGKLHVRNDISGSDSSFIIKASGFTGIGTSNPLEKLEVRGDIMLSTGANRAIYVGAASSGNIHAGYDLTVNAGNSGGSMVGMNPYRGGDLLLKGGNAGGFVNARGGNIYIYGGTPVSSGSQGNLILAHTGTETRGKVGIGTNNPDEKLHIAGSIKIVDGNQGVGKLLVSDASGVGNWTNPATISDGDWTISGNHLYAAISSYSYIGIGTSSPSGKLHVNGGQAGTGANGTRITLKAQDGGDDYTIYGSGGDGGDIVLQPGAGGIGMLGGNGTPGGVAIGTTNPGTYKLYVNGAAYATGGWSGSDRKFKKDIQHIENPLEKLILMQGVSYKWKSEDYPNKNFPDGRHYGVVAQQIEKVLPEIVKTGPEGDLAVAYNEIIAVIIEAVKELDQENSVLKDRIKKLERNNK